MTAMARGSPRGKKLMHGESIWFFYPDSCSYQWDFLALCLSMWGHSIEEPHVGPPGSCRVGVQDVVEGATATFIHCGPAPSLPLYISFLTLKALTSGQCCRSATRLFSWSRGPALALPPPPVLQMLYGTIAIPEPAIPPSWLRNGLQFFLMVVRK